MGLVRKPDVALSDGQPLPRWSFRDTERTPASLTAALGDPDPGVRRLAALDLAGHRPALGALVAAAATEADSAAREAIFTTIAGFDSPEAVTAVLPFLRAGDAGLRNAAVETLAQMPAATPGFVDALLGDADADVRILVVMALASLRSPDVPRWLLQVIAKDPHPNVVSAAVGVLDEVGDATMAAAVESAPGRFPGDPFLRFSAGKVSARLRKVAG